MSSLQEVFDRIQKTKKEQKEIKQAYRDALDNSAEFRRISEELKTLKTQKQQIELDAKREFSAEFTKLEDLKIDLDSDQEMLSDLALNQLVKGETVEITDQYESKYEPVFSVKFKKA